MPIGEFVRRTDLVHIIFRRNIIEKGDVRACLEAINKVTSSAPDAELLGRLEWSIHGYDDDPRELFEMPEVAKTLTELNQAWPHWAFYQSPKGDWLRQLAMCLAGTQRKTATRIEWNSQRLAAHYEWWMRHYNHRCTAANIPHDRARSACERIMALLDFSTPLKDIKGIDLNIKHSKVPTPGTKSTP